MPAAAADRPPAFCARDIAKRYGGVQALKDIQFCVGAGEVRALVGENGAGKSTLVRILCGLARPDSGSLARDGRVVSIRQPRDAEAWGIQAVHQHAEMAMTLTVADNVFMGALPAGAFGGVRQRELERRTQAVLDDLGAHFSASHRMDRLRIADMHIVGIARALVRKAAVIIFDEPTAALPAGEVDLLFQRIRSLRNAGTAVVFVSHRLDEVLHIADHITVLRDGRNVAELPKALADRATLVSAMLGRELPLRALSASRVAPTEAVACSRLSVLPELRDVSFDARHGEIVGIFGMLGAGQAAIGPALFGLRPNARADTCRMGAFQGLPMSPREAIAHAVGYVPSDRVREGLAYQLSVLDNLLLPAWRRFTMKMGWLRRDAARAYAMTAARQQDLRFAHLEQPVSTLSGGNQQKVLLGRWLALGMWVLLLDEPTSGVDVGAKAEIHASLRAFAGSGGAVLICSSDVEEICSVCDRVVVLRDGVVSGVLTGADVCRARVLEAAL